MSRNLDQSSKICLVAFESKIYTVVDMVAKSLGTVVYIVPIKTFEAGTFSITRNFSNLAVVTFAYTIFFIKLDNIGFWPCYLSN